MNAVIVDDEPLARLGIRSLLQKHSDMRIVAECTNGPDAIAAIRQENPDVVFLDIQMPELDGFGVLKSLDLRKLPYIIFVTAYDQYAVRAFDVNALDYLLKPFDDKRFEEALERARTAMGQEDSNKLREKVQSLIERLEKKNYLDRLAVKENDRIRCIRCDEIDWIGSKGNYVEIHSGKFSHLLREIISRLEIQLDPAKFIRIHRTTIVNVDRIRELQPFFHGGYRVIMNDGTQLTLSRRFRDKVRGRLGQGI